MDIQDDLNLNFIPRVSPQKVMSDGVISEGTSASVRGSRKVLLQVTERATKTEGSGTTSPKSATPLDGEDGSRVELNGSGVEVRMSDTRLRSLG